MSSEVMHETHSHMSPGKVLHLLFTPFATKAVVKPGLEA